MSDSKLQSQEDSLEVTPSTMDLQKENVINEEGLQVVYGSNIQYDKDSSALGVDKKKEEVVLRKIDWHIIPFVVLLYLFSFLDRGLSYSYYYSRFLITHS